MLGLKPLLVVAQGFRGLLSVLVAAARMQLTIMQWITLLLFRLPEENHQTNALDESQSSDCHFVEEEKIHQIRAVCQHPRRRCQEIDAIAHGICLRQE